MHLTEPILGFIRIPIIDLFLLFQSWSSLIICRQDRIYFLRLTSINYKHIYKSRLISLKQHHRIICLTIQTSFWQRIFNNFLKVSIDPVLKYIFLFCQLFILSFSNAACYTQPLTSALSILPEFATDDTQWRMIWLEG